MLQQIPHLDFHSKARLCGRAHPCFRLKDDVEFGAVFGGFYGKDFVGVEWIEFVNVFDEFGRALVARDEGFWCNSGR